MKLINVDDSSSNELFPLGIGRQRIALVQGRSHCVTPKEIIQLFLDDECVGTASDFEIDACDVLQGHIRLDKHLDIADFECSAIWERGRLIRIHLHKHKIMVDDKSGLTLIDDQTGARIYNG